MKWRQDIFLGSKRHYFQLKSLHLPIFMNFEQKWKETLSGCRQYSTESSRILQPCTLSYNCLRECHSCKQQWRKSFIQFCSISFTLAMNNFCFINLDKFQILVLRFDLVFSNLNTNSTQYSWPPCTNLFRSTSFEIANFIYIKKTRYLNKDVNHTEPSPSVSVPWLFFSCWV